MTEEEKKKMAALEASVTKLTGDLKLASETIKAKDAIIVQKTNDVVNARQEFQTKYKKLADMTAEEKAAMSEKEIELQKRQEEFDQKQEAFAKTQEETSKRERDYRVTEAIKKIAGNNEEIAKTIRAKAETIIGFDKAMTPDEIGGFVEQGFNMLGQPRPNLVTKAVSGGTGEAGGEDKGNFSETTDGIALAKALNLPGADKMVATQTSETK